MDDICQRIHVNEFAAHMALHAAGPVWNYLFQAQIPEQGIAAIQNHMIAAETPLTVDQVTLGVQQNLGDAALRWMWDCFVSSGEPRAMAQQAVLVDFVAPTVAPLHDPAATRRLTGVLTPERLAALAGLEHLLQDIALQPPDPRDSAFIEATGGFILRDNPTLRLTDSMYLEILAPVSSAAKGVH